MELSWKNHGILFLIFCGNPATKIVLYKGSDVVIWRQLIFATLFPSQNLTLQFEIKPTFERYKKVHHNIFITLLLGSKSVSVLHVAIQTMFIYQV